MSLGGNFLDMPGRWSGSIGGPSSACCRASGCGVFFRASRVAVPGLEESRVSVFS